MKLLPVILATVALSLPLQAGSLSENPLLGEWRLAEPRHPSLLAFRHILFAPRSLIFGRSMAVKVEKYEVAGKLTRVQTSNGDNYLFVLREPNKICSAQLNGAMYYPGREAMPPLEVCFIRDQSATANFSH